MSDGAAEPAVSVATAEELQAALRGGAAHIVVTRHLDLSQIAPDAASAIFSSSDAGDTTSLSAATVSIRGACTATSSAAAEAPAQAGTAAGSAPAVAGDPPPAATTAPDQRAPQAPDESEEPEMDVSDRSATIPAVSQDDSGEYDYLPEDDGSGSDGESDGEDAKPEKKKKPKKKRGKKARQVLKDFGIDIGRRLHQLEPPPLPEGVGARQCVLHGSGKAAVFAWAASGSNPPSVWLDNLFLIAGEDAPGHRFVAHSADASHALYMTNVTVRGAGAEVPGRTSDAAVQLVRTRALLQDCDIQHLGAEALVATGSTTALQRCTVSHIDTTALEHTVASPEPREAAAVRARWGSKIRMEACAMSDNADLDLSTYDPARDAGEGAPNAGLIFTDAAVGGAGGWTVGDEGQGEVLPLVDGAGVNWLTEGNAGISQLRERASAAAVAAFGYEQAAALGLTTRGQQPPMDGLPASVAARPRGGGAAAVAPPPLAPPPPPPPSSEADVPVSAIVGGVFALLILLCAAAAAVALLFRRRRARDKAAHSFRTPHGSDPVDVQTSQSPSARAFPFSISNWSTNSAFIPDAEPAPAAIAARKAADKAEETLVATVHAMAAAQPPALLAGQYALSTDMVQGGQSMVVFARGRDASLRQYAIKFFYSQETFRRETAFYEREAFRKCLPELVTTSTACAPSSHGGYALPPFIVLDRGLTLTDWLKTPRVPSSIFAMATDVATLLGALHGSGSVHRDLKPENLLLVMHTQTWRLLDLGIAAAVEAVAAYSTKESLPVRPALDVWALGVIVFECFTERPVFGRYARTTRIHDCASGKDQYPWERGPRDIPEAWTKSRARPIFEQCLARDPSERPTALGLARALRGLDNVTTRSTAFTCVE